MKFPRDDGSDFQQADPLPRLIRMEDGSFRFNQDYEQAQGGDAASGFGEFTDKLLGSGNAWASAMGIFMKMFDPIFAQAMGGGEGQQQPTPPVPQPRTRLAESIVNRIGGGGAA